MPTLGTETLELSDKKFKAVIIKFFDKQLKICLKQIINKKWQEKNRRCKEDPSGNFRTEKYNKKKKISKDRLNIKIKGTEEKLVNWNIEQ